MAEAATSAPRKNLLLRIGVHETRTPIAVVLGYASMLLSGRAGDLTDMQRHMLEELKKSTTKLAGLADEMNDLSLLEAGSVKFNLARVDLGAVIAQEIPAVAPAAEREVSIRLINQSPPVTVNADLKWFKDTLNSLLFSHRRELFETNELCVVIERISPAAVRVTIAGADRIDGLRRVPESKLEPLVELRGGMGYRLSIARKVIEGHGGRIFSQTEPGSSPDSIKVVGAVIILPEA